MNSPSRSLPRSTSEPANGTLHTVVPLPREPSSVSVSPLNPAQLQNVPLNDTSVSRRSNNTETGVIRQGFGKSLLPIYFFMIV